MKKVYGIDVDGLQYDNNRLNEENGRCISRINSLVIDKDSLSETVACLETDMDSIRKENQQKKDKITILQKQNEDANKKIENLKVSLDTANEEIKSLKEKFPKVLGPERLDEEYIDEIENLKRYNDSLQIRLQQAKEESRKLKAITSNQESTIDNQKKKIEELENKLKPKDDIPQDTPQEPIPGELPPIEVVDGSTVVGGIPTGNVSEPSPDPNKRTIDTVIDILNSAAL